MVTDLEGKFAIVTGGAMGIGRATCLAFAKHRTSVAVVDVDRHQAKDVVAEITKDRGNAIVVEADVSDETEVDRAVAEVINAFGRIDVLVNNAAIEILTPMLSAKVEDWDKVLNTVHSCSPERFSLTCSTKRAAMSSMSDLLMGCEVGRMGLHMQLLRQGLYVLLNRWLMRSPNIK
jgi:NAD(P)-dependent dehydrogenase (short-subunit alcohol dehydrogenase family)